MLKTNHTEGQWIVNVTDRVIEKNPHFYTIENGDGEELALVSTEHNFKTCEANLKLIHLCPETLQLLIDQYLFLQIESRENVSFAVKTDSRRAILRNHISEVTGLSAKEVQESIEELALENN